MNEISNEKIEDKIQPKSSASILEKEDLDIIINVDNDIETGIEHNQIVIKSFFF